MTDTGGRWQYVIANIGMLGAVDRMTRVLGYLGSNGYELATVYDKASNWLTGMEKGFMLFKRHVPAGTDPVGDWCQVLDPSQISMRNATPDLIDPPYL